MFRLAVAKQCDLGTGRDLSAKTQEICRETLVGRILPSKSFSATASSDGLLLPSSVSLGRKYNPLLTLTRTPAFASLASALFAAFNEIPEMSFAMSKELRDRRAWRSASSAGEMPDSSFDLACSTRSLFQERLPKIIGYTGSVAVSLVQRNVSRMVVKPFESEAH